MTDKPFDMGLVVASKKFRLKREKRPSKSRDKLKAESLSGIARRVSLF
jgi:hypothetical protein